MTEHPLGDPKGAEQPEHKKRKPEQEEEDALDRTIEESFPASDPPSSIPNPEEEEDAA